MKANSELIPDLFKVIDSLNVHHHHAFKTLAFSDTIIVYNSVDPQTEDDHRYLVMYACEFVQDLFYRTINKQIYFRSVLRYGEFKHYSLSNLDAFFGEVLVDVFLQQKEIQSLGFFIDKTCSLHNRFFPTVKYDDRLSFVFLTSALERIHSVYSDSLPVEPIILEDTDEFWRIVWDVEFLKNIHFNKSSFPDPKVRTKYLTAWEFYSQRYSKVLNQLETRGFSLDTISPDHDWSGDIERLHSW